MKYLFIFAHPDDEAVANAGTISRLVSQGDSVKIISATAGGSGELNNVSQEYQAQYQSVAELRRAELASAANEMGVSELEILDFEDGKITNQQVWGELTDQIQKKIDQFQPDFVVTFDHSGWYFHLDHVAVSIVTTRAFKQASHQAEGLFLSHFRPGDITDKWDYVYRPMPITHEVTVNDISRKKRVLEQHQSQNLQRVYDFMEAETPHKEVYQLVFVTKRGQEVMSDHPVFKTRAEKS